jgi:hypothetical protein
LAGGGKKKKLSKDSIAKIAVDQSQACGLIPPMGDPKDVFRSSVVYTSSGHEEEMTDHAPTQQWKNQP